jgi:hypothetical protein
VVGEQSGIFDLDVRGDPTLRHIFRLRENEQISLSVDTHGQGEGIVRFIGDCDQSGPNSCQGKMPDISIERSQSVLVVAG